jgi:hypothetical protein
LKKEEKEKSNTAITAITIKRFLLALVILFLLNVGQIVIYTQPTFGKKRNVPGMDTIAGARKFCRADG